MISFQLLTQKNKESVISSLSEKLSPKEKEELHSIVSSFDTEDEDVEFALSWFSGCLLVRIFDMGRYLFVFPYEICRSAETELAIGAVSEYAMREEIPLIFTDVPAESLSVFAGFRHMDVDAEDEEGRAYRVRIKTECELLSEIPETTRGRVALNAICEEDIEDYARLCRDKSINKYWGYDYTEDESVPADAYFYDNASLEFARGVSVCMAIRFNGAFCGESVIYAFDGRGGAEFAIRLLPEYHGRGLGTESVMATVEAAKSMGLTVLYSKIFSENLPSVAMLKRVTDKWTESDGTHTFTIYLN